MVIENSLFLFILEWDVKHLKELIDDVYIINKGVWSRKFYIVLQVELVANIHTHYFDYQPKDADSEIE